jgi:hypothetical protein
MDQVVVEHLAIRSASGYDIYFSIVIPDILRLRSNIGCRVLPVVQLPM